MSEAALLATVTVTAYVSTNLDNLLVLTALLAAVGRRATVVLAHGLISVAVLAAAWALGSLGQWIPAEAAGLLGLIPLTLGLIGLAGLLRGGAAAAPPPGNERPAGGFGSVVAGLLPLCGDSLAVAAPLLAESPPRMDLVIGVTWLASAALWAGLALALVSLPGARRWLSRAAGPAMPVLLIAVGLYVLADTPTDALVRAASD